MSVSVYTLLSSSKGNCTLITDGETHFLIDAGCSLKKLTAALSELRLSPDMISGVFVTHEHTDHICGIERLCGIYHTPVHATSKTARHLKTPTVVEHRAEYEFDMGKFRVSSFPLSHDTPCCVGYRVEHTSGVMVGSATDTGYITKQAYNALYGCEAVILESNYDDAMLKNGPYPPMLKFRIASDTGHLSNADSAAFLPYLYKGGVRRVLLAHLSEQNNTPDLAYAAALKSKKYNGLEELYIECAQRTEITKLI